MAEHAAPRSETPKEGRAQRSGSGAAPGIGASPVSFADRVLGLQRTAGNAAVSRFLSDPALRFEPLRPTAGPSVVHRLLNAGERAPLDARCLALEGRIEAAVARLPAIIRTTFGKDHPLLEPVRAELVRVRANFGNDDRADITGKLDGYENRIATLEANINANLPQIQQVTRLWTIQGAAATFGPELAEFKPEIAALAREIYRGKVISQELDAFNRKLERVTASDSKAMTRLRKNNVLGAIDRVAKYVALGYVAIDPLNSFYASTYDAAEDAFGAAAGLSSTTSSGGMQWLHAWEFHIHASVDRAGGRGTPVTGLRIHTGHIKPTDVARDTGTSITVPQAMHAGVIATSTAGVVRWANSSKAAPVLRKQ
jgi:hypothetical protein